MTLRYYLDGSELTNVSVTGRVKRGALDGLVSSAFGGDIGTSGIVIDDPTGNVIVGPFQPFHVIEDACAPSRIWTGYISARRISRSDMNADGIGRVWDCDLMDLNFLLGLRVLRGAAAKRPDETDVERVQWLLGTLFMTEAGPGIFDNGFVLTSSPHPYDGADYHKEFPNQLIDSVIGRTKTYWVYWDEIAEQASLFYGPHTTAFGNLDVRLSNDPDDIDDDADPQTTFAAIEGSQLVDRNPEDLADGLLYDWRGSDIYRQRTATFDDIGIHRDVVYSTERVGSASTASSQTDALLVTHSVEQDTLTCIVHLKEDQVNWFREGWRVQAKFTHLPGYANFTWITIQKRTVRQAPNAIDRYEVTLQLAKGAPQGGGGAGGQGGGDPGVFPHQPPCPVGWDIVPTADGADGGLLTVTMPNGASSALSTDSFLFYDSCTYGLVYHLDPHHDDALQLAPTDGGLATATFGASITPGLDTEARVHASGVGGDGDHDWSGEGVTTIPGGSCDFVASLFRSAYLDAGAGGTVLTIGATYISGPDPRFEDIAAICAADPAENPPAAGKPVPPAPPASGTADGSNTDFATVYPYATSSLHVEMNGSELSSGVDFTETSPATGGFTFTRPPLADAQIVVWYQGR